MKIKGLRNSVKQADLVRVLKKHLDKDANRLHTIARQITEGLVIELDDDWALEQDLKDLGVKVE